MNVGHQLIGFRKSDDFIGDEHEVPDDLLEYAKRLAKVRRDDPDAVFPYPLRPAIARKLAAAMGVAINPEHHNYFLEGYAKTEASSAAVMHTSAPVLAAIN